MKYVALLRGINVGGNKKVAMPKLKKMFEALGFSNVSTYINSGNVIFETKKSDAVKSIEKALAQTFGFEIKVVVRSAADIKGVSTAVPKNWTNDEHQKTDVLFLWDSFNGKKSLKLIASTAADTLMYVNGAIVWNILRKNYNKSGMHAFIGTELYKHITARNINTVRKLAKLVSRWNTSGRKP